METTDPSASDDGVDAGAVLRAAGATLTALVAVFHLFHPAHGVLKLFALLAVRPTTLVFDPRPLAFVLSGTALIVGLSLSRNAPDRRPYYVVGVVLAATYFLGYFAWHFSGHGGFLPGRQPLLHGLTPIENVRRHLTSDPLAAASKVAELAMIAVLGALLRRE